MATGRCVYTVSCAVIMSIPPVSGTLTRKMLPEGFTENEVDEDESGLELAADGLEAREPSVNHGPNARSVGTHVKHWFYEMIIGMVVHNLIFIMKYS